MSKAKQTSTSAEEGKSQDYRQQILFDDAELLDGSKSLDGEDPLGGFSDAGDEELIAQQLVFDNQDWLPAEFEPKQDSSNNVKAAKSGLLWPLTVVLLLAIIVLELVDFFTLGFANAPISTSLYAALLACLGSIVGLAVVREFLGLRQLKKQWLKQQQALHLASQPLSSQNNESAQGLSEQQSREQTIVFCQSINVSLACDLPVQTLEAWQQTVSKSYNSKELLTLYQKQVLAHADQKALDEIAKYASESVVLIALSPLALLDMLIMFWRNIHLVDKIAGLYGLKLGYWSRIKLIKQVMMNILYAGASELVADYGADMLGAGLLGRLSGRMAQGVGAGLLTARLGIKTMAVCRPIAFTEQPPKLSHIRRAISKQVKQLLKP